MLINAVFFAYLNDAGVEYIARSWLRDPTDAEARRSVQFLSEASQLIRVRSPSDDGEPRAAVLTFFTFFV